MADFRAILGDDYVNFYDLVMQIESRGVLSPAGTLAAQGFLERLSRQLVSRRIDLKMGGGGKEDRDRAWRIDRLLEQIGEMLHLLEEQSER